VTQPPDVDRRLLDQLIAAACRAAAAILAVGSDLQQREKADRSPVTAADEAAETALLEAFARVLPGVPVVSEESAHLANPERLGARFLMVDPLDGTRELIAGFPDYTVNIALIDRGRPVAGVIAAPALGTIWAGATGLGAERLRILPGGAAGQGRTPIRTRRWPPHGAVAVVSRFHRDRTTDGYLDRFAGIERVVVGSSIKFCRIAEGAADLYVRTNSISEWDVAAGHALMVAAGGAMTGLDGKPLPYGRAGYRVPPFIGWGDGASPMPGTGSTG
jgi:3'(2'), 5'-bisphosphate nucleotidase